MKRVLKIKIIIYSKHLFLNVYKANGVKVYVLAKKKKKLLAWAYS